MPELKNKARDGWQDAEVDVNISFMSGDKESKLSVIFCLGLVG